jgi:hypothetical protein
MCREFRSLHDQYHEYFSAEKFLDPDSLALARSVFEKFQVFTFQPHWIFYFVLLIKYTQWGFESRTRANTFARSLRQKEKTIRLIWRMFFSFCRSAGIRTRIACSQSTNATVTLHSDIKRY